MANDNLTCYSDFPLERRMAYAQEITDELINEQDRLLALVFALDETINKEVNVVGFRLIEVLTERLTDISRLHRLMSCFKDAHHA